MHFQLNVLQDLLIVWQVEDSALMACNEYADISGKWFMDPSIDKTITAKKLDEKTQSEIVQN